MSTTDNRWPKFVNERLCANIICIINKYKKCFVLENGYILQVCDSFVPVKFLGRLMAIYLGFFLVCFVCFTALSSI